MQVAAMHDRVDEERARCGSIVLANTPAFNIMSSAPLFTLRPQMG